MTRMWLLTRRAALFSPLLIAACADDDELAPPPPRRDFPPPRYGYLPPIELNVQRVDIVEDAVPQSDGPRIGGSVIAETLFGLARDRLKPMGGGGIARFRIISASIARRRDTLTGALAVRLDIGSDTGDGYAEARAGATKTGGIDDLDAASYEMLKAMMDDLNVEFEFQIRAKLRNWIAGQQPMAPAIPPDTPPPPRPPVPVENAPIDLSPRR